MVQQDMPDDYVLATGVKTSVRKFVDLAFDEVGIELEWQGVGVSERGLCKKTGECLVEVDPRYFRPTEVELLLGNPEKAREKLGWTHETSVADLVKEMVFEDLKVMRNGPISKEG
jgi:GDPmannose 4,6-dehydratase